MRTTAHVALAKGAGCLSYYGLRDGAFSSGVAPGRPWISRNQAEALSALTEAARRGDGCLLLTGEGGTGKTQLLARLVDTLRDAPLIVGQLRSSVFEVSELSQAVAEAFTIGQRFPSASAFATSFRQFLGEARAAGKRVLLAVDDAHKLADEVLGKLFDLSMIGRFEENPLAILLVGQPELVETLEKSEHAPMHPRITARCILERLSTKEVGDYVRTRLREAGAEAEIFDSGAVERIASISRGAPGVINVVCERALVAGYERSARPIGRAIVDTAFGVLADSPPGSSWDGGEAEGEAEDQENRELEQGVAERKGAASRTPGWDAPRLTRRRLGIALLAASVLAAGSYSLYTMWSGRSQMDLAAKRGPDSPSDKQLTEQDGREAPAVATTQQSRTQAEPAEPDHDVGSRLPNGDGRGAGAQSPVPTRARAVRPRDPSTSETAVSRSPQQAGESVDPGAIIDWLIRESGRR